MSPCALAATAQYARVRFSLAVVIATLPVAMACNDSTKGPAVYSAKQKISMSDVPMPAADGPRLGAVAHVTPIRATPSAEGELLGYLRAGGQVARADAPLTREGCEEGWYPVRTRGFVCAGKSATTNLEHPTLVAMSLRPKADEVLPYAFARVKRAATLFERDPQRGDGVKELLRVPRHSGLAIVGSWSAFDVEGKKLRLGMTTQGQFIEAEALKVAEPSEFRGAEISEEQPLPVGFVVKRGVHYWRLNEKGKTEKKRELKYHERVSLTGRFRTVESKRFWASSDEQWVRHQDVTVIRRRNAFPDFAVEGQKWVDVSVITGTAVLYEGQRPVFATLVSVGRDRSGDPEATDSTALGTFQVTGKHLTSSEHDPTRFAEGVLLYDVPWVVELSSGQLMHGSYSHDRFGIEHGPGNVQLSPSDAKLLWSWVEPELPDGWHGVVATAEKPALVHVRK